MKRHLTQSNLGTPPLSSLSYLYASAASFWRVNYWPQQIILCDFQTVPSNPPDILQQRIGRVSLQILHRLHSFLSLAPWTPRIRDTNASGMMSELVFCGAVAALEGVILWHATAHIQHANKEEGETHKPSSFLCIGCPQTEKRYRKMVVLQLVFWCLVQPRTKA